MRIATLLCTGAWVVGWSVVGGSLGGVEVALAAPNQAADAAAPSSPAGPEPAGAEPKAPPAASKPGAATATKPAGTPKPAAASSKPAAATTQPAAATAQPAPQPGAAGSATGTAAAAAPAATPAAAAAPTEAPTAAPAATAPSEPALIVPARRLPTPRYYAIEPPAPEPKRQRADAGAPFAFGLGGALRYRRDSNYDKLGETKSHGELDLFASYDVWQPLRRLVVAAGANYLFGRVGDDDFIEVTNHTVHAELSARYTLTRWLFPHVRGSFGVSTSKLRLNDDSGAISGSDGDTGMSGMLGGGLTLRTPARLFEARSGRAASLSLGFLIEAGYAFVSPASFRVAPKADSDIAQQPIDLGSLDGSGAYLRMLLVVRL